MNQPIEPVAAVRPAAVSPAPLPIDRVGPLVALGLSLAWLLYWYRGTVASLVDIWSRSDTYTHGFLIAPISLWLVWRMRERLAGVPLRPSAVGVLAGLAAGLAWLLGELGSVDSVSQFALVGMVISLVWALLGSAMVRALAFPLGFLFLAVPFGEFLFPTMMDWTANFVIGALRFSGVPVYAEGHNLVIPSGHWSVVEGCSGVRYLIASVVVGCLYAYLSYRSLSRRVIFIGVSIIVPIIANWLRAYGTVLLGHLSNNRLAAGVDHLVYGWVFFGMVMTALFWIGARWREDEAPLPAVAGSAASTASAVAVGGEGGRATPGLSLRGVLWLTVGLAAVLMWKPAYHWLDAQGGHGPVMLAPPSATVGWSPLPAAQMPEWNPRYSGMRAVLREGWARAGAAGEARPVWVYIGYYRDQEPGQELINSENRIARSKDPVWRTAGIGDRDIVLGDTPVAARSTELFHGEQRLLIWHWYWLAGRWTTNDYLAKLYLVLARLSGRGDDSAVVMAYAPFARGERAEAEGRLETFTREMRPSITQTLGRAMEH